MKPKENIFTEAEMLTYIRHQSGCYATQRELADKLGVSESLLSKILKGERAITDHVAKFFGRKRVVLFVVPEKEQEQS